MSMLTDALGRDGEAFQRAFEAAQVLEQDPDAWSRLHQAVEDLVRSGAILNDEAVYLESLLKAGKGRFLPRSFERTPFTGISQNPTFQE